MAQDSAPIRAGSPAITSPAAWPSVISRSGAAKARSAATRSASSAPGRCLPAYISSSSAACSVAKRTYVRATAASRERKSPPGRVQRGGHLPLQPLEAVERERVQQRLLAREVPPRRGVADPDLARDLAQRELVHAPARERALGALEHRGPEVAVVIGADRGGHDGKASARS